MTENEAAFRLKIHNNELTRQQVKTLYGQIQHGQPNAAMRGFDMILKRREQKNDEA